MLSTTEQTFDATTELTAAVSSLHVAKADLHSIRQIGWPLPHKLTADRLWLSLSSTDASPDFAYQLRGLGFSPAFTDLVRWAIDDGKCWLLIDKDVELNDKLLIFVG